MAQPLTIAPAAAQRAGSLLAAAVTPPETLVRAVPHAGSVPGVGGWSLLDPGCWTGPQARVDIDGTGATDAKGVPFEVEAFDECSTIGITRDQLPAMARDLLARVEGAAIARELWTGELATEAAAGDPDSPWADNARLVSPDTTDITPTAGTAVPIKMGQGLLEQALADRYPGQAGAIHGARIVVPFLPDATAQGDLLVTKVGTRIIVDAGYPGTGPDGSTPAAGTAWLYGTTRPTVWLGDPGVTPGDVGQAVDRDRNTLQYGASRLALVVVPNDVVAVLVTLA